MTALPPPVEAAPIARVAVRPLPVRLARPWADDVNAVTFVEVVVTDGDGAQGRGFSWTPQIGASAVASLLRDDITAWAAGRPADPVALWQPLWRHLHEAGGGGLTTIAMAGLDLALWDLRCRRAGRSLGDELGVVHDELPAYGSGVNLHYSTDELVDQVGRWVAAGFEAVKIKVGSPDVTRDVERLRAVRDVLGSRTLMIDANQRWDLDAATAAMGALAQFEPAWIEEPLRADDLAGYRELASRIDTPIACGENLYTRYRFAEFADADAVGTLQPNVIRVGGITPALQIAHDTIDRGVDLALHLLPELSAQVARCLPVATAVEVVDGALLDDLGALAAPSPLTVVAGRARVRTAPGLGITLTSA